MMYNSVTHDDLLSEIGYTTKNQKIMSGCILKTSFYPQMCDTVG